MGFFVRIYMRVCKKMVIYLGIKTPQSRKERKYTWEKTARVSCHNFETNGRPYSPTPVNHVSICSTQMVLTSGVILVCGGVGEKKSHR